MTIEGKGSNEGIDPEHRESGSKDAKDLEDEKRQMEEGRANRRKRLIAAARKFGIDEPEALIDVPGFGETVREVISAEGAFLEIRNERDELQKKLDGVNKRLSAQESRYGERWQALHSFQTATPGVSAAEPSTPPTREPGPVAPPVNPPTPQG